MITRISLLLASIIFWYPWKLSWFASVFWLLWCGSVFAYFIPLCFYLKYNRTLDKYIWESISTLMKSRIIIKAIIGVCMCIVSLIFFIAFVADSKIISWNVTISIKLLIWYLVAFLMFFLEWIYLILPLYVVRKYKNN